MIRVLQVEIDERYFDRYGAAFFKSFYRYNKGWKLFVVDLGLREEQRDILSRYGDVVSYPRDPYRRWGQLSSRINAWCDIFDRYDVMLHLDVDAVILDSFEEEYDALIEGEYDLAGQDGRHSSMAISSRYRRGAEQMLGLQPDDPLFDEHAQIHAGWLLMRNTAAMRDTLIWFRDNWDQYSIYTTEEETGLGALVYSRGLKLCRVTPTDSPELRPSDKAYIVPCIAPPSSFTPYPMKYCHFAFSKYFTDHTSAGHSRETYMAWCDVLLRPYANLPWPDVGVVDGR